MKVVLYSEHSTGVPYLPDWNGNRELKKEEDQIIVWIIPLSMGAHVENNKKTKAEFKKGRFKTNSDVIARKSFVNHVIKVEGFIGVDPDTGEEKSITDIKEFYDRADAALINDIVEAIEKRSVLEEGKKTVLKP